MDEGNEQSELTNAFYFDLVSNTQLPGIATVTERLLQQAVLQIITAWFEFGFSDYKYGFRPNRNLHQSVIRAQG